MPLWGVWETAAQTPAQSVGLAADMLAVIPLTTIQPRPRGRGFETAEQAATEEKSNPALETALSDVLGIYHKVRQIAPTQYPLSRGGRDAVGQLSICYTKWL